MVIAFARAIALRIGKDSRFSEYGPSKKWWSWFKARNANLTLRKFDNLKRYRAEALSVDVKILSHRIVFLANPGKYIMSRHFIAIE